MCAPFPQKYKSIFWGPRVLLRRNSSSEATKNPTKFVGFFVAEEEGFVLVFCKATLSAVFMLFKSLRAAAKNDAPCRFLNALVRIPLT